MNLVQTSMRHIDQSSEVPPLLEAARQHYRADRLEEAEHLCRQMLRLHPQNAPALHLLGQIAYRLGKPGVAAAFAQKAVSIEPGKASFHNGLGAALLALGRPSEAEASFQRALGVDPRHAAAHVNLGAALLALGRPSEAEASFQRALELAPGYAEAHSNILFARHYLPGYDREALFRQAKQWGERHAAGLAREIRPHRNPPHPARRLRIGYVSGDLRRHPVGYALAAIIPAHDKTAVEVFCYANQRRADDLTVRLRAVADHWRSVASRSDADVAQMVREDAIDILIDLSGHTEGSRLGVFARKPAPVQATWLGYFDTTGAPAIDYLIADHVVCPPGDDGYYVECVVRLPHAFLCYTPPPGGDVAPVPSLARGHVTFGCFNNIAKVTPDVVALWAEILARLPSARICLKASALSDGAVQERYLRLFAQCGVAAGRVDLLGHSPYADYLAAYSRIDVALDPFPYNGGATSIESLWMGVPIVSLRGDHFVSRMGASILATAGLPELVAESAPEYVDKVVALAMDWGRLSDLRADLRARLARSPLFDGPGFARGLEAAYRQMWTAWCQQRSQAHRR